MTPETSTFRERFRDADWLDFVLLQEKRRTLGPGVEHVRRVWLPKFGIPLLAVLLLGFVACVAWAVVEAVVS